MDKRKIWKKIKKYVKCDYDFISWFKKHNFDFVNDFFVKNCKLFLFENNNNIIVIDLNNLDCDIYEIVSRETLY